MVLTTQFHILCRQFFQLSFSSKFSLMHILKLPPFCKLQIYSPKLMVPPYFFQGDLGFLYLDLYSRKGKYPGCAHFAIKGGRKVSETEYQLPVCIMLASNF